MGIVNRRHTAISKFESWWSIGHKQAYLNRVSFSQFVFTVHRDATVRSEKGVLHPYLIDEIDKHLVADLLKESVETFDFSTLTPYIPEWLTGFITLEDQFRYCPDCLKLGFHSPVHQLPWLEKCLIHGLSLVRGCPSCKRQLGYPLSQAKSSRVDRYHCPCGEPLWTDILLSSWPNLMDRKTLQPIQTYLDWIKDLTFPGIESLPSAFDFINFASASGGTINAQWLMCCLAAISNVPDSIRSAFFKIQIPHIQHISSSDVKANTIIQVIQTVGFRKLLESYMFWYEQTNLQPLLMSHANAIIPVLTNGHARCLKGQLRLNDLYLHNWADRKFYCNKVQNAFRFSTRWMWLHDDDRDSYYKEAAFELAVTLEKMGVVFLATRENKTFDPKWSACGRTVFLGDMKLDIHVCTALAQLLESIWKMELIKSANWLLSSDSEVQRHALMPFCGWSNPLVLVELGSNNDLDVMIWPRSTLESTLEIEYKKPVLSRLKQHIAQVAKEIAEEEARLIRDGNPLEKLLKRISSVSSR
jgi:hypothetical protein